jgi:G3E family GTPase
LHHLVSSHQGGHLALIVENPDALNLDARALGGLCGAAGRTLDLVLAFPPADEAEQVAWLAARLRELAAAGRFERVIVEVGGDANPARLGKHFGLLPGQPDELAEFAELEQIVVVLDALDFYRGVVMPGRSPTAWIDFQHAQIEGATLLVLNKCDLVDDAQREKCARLMLTINPSAPFVETAYGEVSAEIWSRPAAPEVLALALERRLRPGAADELTKVMTSDPALAVSLYRAHRPFHPQRFWDWLEEDAAELLRVKGLVWLATRNLLVGGVSRLRWQTSCGAAGIWWAALPREEWPREEEALRRMQETWHEPYGDRRQELVLVGSSAALEKAAQRIATCLLNDDEFSRPPTTWQAFPDPFPAWDLTQD